MNAIVGLVLACTLALVGLPTVAVAAGDQPLTGPELTELLGLGASSSLRWSRTDGPDFRVYCGQSADGPPAGVGFYLGSAPAFKPDAHATAHPARLGAFEVVWQRWRREGSFYQTTLIPLPDDAGEGSFIHAWVYGPDQASLDGLARQLGALPRFAHAPAAK